MRKENTYMASVLIHISSERTAIRSLHQKEVNEFIEHLEAKFKNNSSAKLR